MLTENWKTCSLEISKDLEAPFMKLIKLPPIKGFLVEKDNETEALTISLMKIIYERYNLVSCIVCIQKQLFVRISCFPYNEIDDYVALKNAITNLAS
jgi:hypothetical protein